MAFISGEVLKEAQPPHKCPRRAEGAVFVQSEFDEWREMPNGDLTCSYCGSWETQQFLNWCETATEGTLEFVKGYKFYIRRDGVSNAGDGAIKFYTPHLTREEGNANQAMINKAMKRLAWDRDIE